MPEIQIGDVCTLSRSHGPFSSGTLVRVQSMGNTLSTVKITGNIDDAYAKNLKAHGIRVDGIFEIPTSSLTRRRLRSS